MKKINLTLRIDKCCIELLDRLKINKSDWVEKMIYSLMEKEPYLNIKTGELEFHETNNR